MVSMRGKRYDEVQKSRIIRTALDVRQKGGTWDEAHTAAAEHGYRSSPVALQALIGSRRRGRPAPEAEAPKNGNGHDDFGLSDGMKKIDKMVDRLANKRAAEILESVVEDLKKRS